MWPNDYSACLVFVKVASNCVLSWNIWTICDLNRQKMDEGWRRPKLRLTKVSRRNCVINGQTAPTWYGFVGFVFKLDRCKLLDLFLTDWCTFEWLGYIGCWLTHKGCNVTAELESSYQAIHPIVTEGGRYLSWTNLEGNFHAFAPRFVKHQMSLGVDYVRNTKKYRGEIFSRADLISILFPTSPLKHPQLLQTSSLWGDREAPRWAPCTINFHLRSVCMCGPKLDCKVAYLGTTHFWCIAHARICSGLVNSYEQYSPNRVAI